MITKETIRNGFGNGKISIEDAFGDCTSLCCRIGDFAFYFAGAEGYGLTAEEYLSEVTMDEIVSRLYDILKDAESAEKNGLECTEFKYYESVLNSRQRIAKPLCFIVLLF